MDGRKHGHGIWIINEEKRYVGEFDSGDIHGQGARCFCVCFCLCSLCVPGTLYVHHCCFQGLWHDWTIQKGLAHQLGRGWFEFEFLQGPQDIKYLRNIFDPRPEILRRVQVCNDSVCSSSQFLWFSTAASVRQSPLFSSRRTTNVRPWSVCCVRFWRRKTPELWRRS